MTCALPISAGAVALGPLEPLGPGAPRVRPAQRSLGALAPAGARRRSPAARPTLSRRQEPRRLRFGTRRRRQRQKARPSVAQRGRKPMTRKRKKELETQGEARSEEHTSELQSLMRISYAVFCLKKKNNTNTKNTHTQTTHYDEHIRPHQTQHAH